ncbi:hypothetical protein DE146DRAFT_251767 [Phaeosphaeria sp. MPI-PUGE-AT-0046c]|nr:hypothetical protein DE146DRAFT_251767 [Phaeosphaeria sp. MPI-PUGE-AT-0046c]
MWYVRRPLAGSPISPPPHNTANANSQYAPQPSSTLSPHTSTKMPNIMDKILEDKSMDIILNIAKSIAETAAAERKAILSTFVGFVIGGITFYLFVRRTTSKPKNGLGRAARPAPLILLTAIDPSTGLTKITPPEKIVHNAPDRYGSAAPGPRGMEIHEEVAWQAARDLEEAEASATRLRAANQARDQSVFSSIKRVHELSQGLPDREVDQGGLVTAVRGTCGMAGGEENGVGGGMVAEYEHSIEGSNDNSETLSGGDLEGGDETEDGNASKSMDEDSWDESIWGLRDPRDG